MVNNIFVNLPVVDLERSKAFFAALGFTYNPQFTDEKAACMLVGPNIFAMLLVEPFFQTFIKTPIANAHQSTEVLLGIGLESREKIDELLGIALAAGVIENREPQDHGFMYSRAFHDLDGHIWELIWMDPSVVQ